MRLATDISAACSVPQLKQETPFFWLLHGRTCTMARLLVTLELDSRCTIHRRWSKGYYDATAAVRGHVGVCTCTWSTSLGLRFTVCVIKIMNKNRAEPPRVGSGERASLLCSTSTYMLKDSKNLKPLYLPLTSASRYLLREKYSTQRPKQA